MDAADQFTVLVLPTLKAFFLRVRFAMPGHKRLQFQQQPLTGTLESACGTLEAFKKLNADERYDLFLPVLDEWINFPL